MIRVLRASASRENGGTAVQVCGVASVPSGFVDVTESLESIAESRARSHELARCPLGLIEAPVVDQVD
ncbi:MAG: hypothetical protein HYV07_31470, partial [Deltaproteobacteria bacterium]|nr:hypothetical protein [Deltaproteobacteria bacterium]